MAGAQPEDQAAELGFELRARTMVRRLRRRPGRPPRTPAPSDAAGRREVAQAMAEMELACERIDEGVARAFGRHAPVGSPPFLLAIAAGAVVAGVTARSIPWSLAIGLSLAGAALTWVVLLLFRVASWSRQHPLLAEMNMLLHRKRRGEDAEYDILELGELIVRRYLPHAEGESLRATLQQARARVALLLELDGE